MQLYNDALTQI